MSKRSARTLVCSLTAVGIVATSGCGLTVEKLPLPKPGVGGDTYVVHAVFDNALNLPTAAHVKVSGADVGQVTDITTKNFQADVDMKIRKDVQLPTTTTAELRQNTPLGDVYVQLKLPQTQPGTKMLPDGGMIPIQQTSAGASVEDLLLSVTTLINGGALNQISNIASELDSMVAGKAPEVSNLIVQMTGAVSELNRRTDDIDNVLRELDTTLATLNERRDTLGRTADSLPPAIGTLAENNRRISDLLSKISTTSAALGDFADTTGGDTSKLLDSTNTLMSELANTGDKMGAALDALHQIYPKAHATFQGSTYAVSAIATYLSIGAFHDPGSQLPTGADVQAFAGSLVDTLQRVYGRVTGATGGPR